MYPTTHPSSFSYPRERCKSFNYFIITLTGVDGISTFVDTIILVAPPAAKLCLGTELRQPSMTIMSALGGRYTSCRRTSY